MELRFLADLFDINWATTEYFDARKIYNEPERKIVLQRMPRAEYE